MGDYYDFERPTVIIDRKQNIREIASNATKDHERLNDELRRLKQLNRPMVFLITQSKINGKKIECLEDLMLWDPPKGQGTVSGMRVYKILSAWRYKHNIKFVFCEPKQAGAKIIEILEGGYELYEHLD